MYLKPFFCIFILYAAVFIPSVFAQGTAWVTVEGMASMENVTKEEARRLAIEDAMRNAVEEVVGVNVLADTIVTNFMLSGDIVKVTPYGKVVDKEIIEEGVREIREKGKTTPSLIYRVKMKVKVSKEEGTTDPYFKINATLNRNVFNEGDEMVIKVSSTKDCYITIFNITEDEKTLILMPNRFRRENFIKANEAIIFPDEYENKRGIKLKATLPSGRKSVTERMYILALKQKLNFDTGKYTEGIHGIYTGKTAFINALLKEIVDIPLSERSEGFIQYQIKAGSEN